MIFDGKSKKNVIISLCEFFRMYFNLFNGKNRSLRMIKSYKNERVNRWILQ